MSKQYQRQKSLFSIQDQGQQQQPQQQQPQWKFSTPSRFNKSSKKIGKSSQLYSYVSTKINSFFDSSSSSSSAQSYERTKSSQIKSKSFHHSRKKNEPQIFTASSSNQSLNNIYQAIQEEEIKDSVQYDQLQSFESKKQQQQKQQQIKKNKTSTKLLSQMYWQTRNKRAKEQMRKSLAQEQSKDRSLAQIYHMSKLLDSDIIKSNIDNSKKVEDSASKDDFLRRSIDQKKKRFMNEDDDDDDDDEDDEFDDYDNRQKQVEWNKQFQTPEIKQKYAKKSSIHDNQQINVEFKENHQIDYYSTPSTKKPKFTQSFTQPLKQLKNVQKRRLQYNFNKINYLKQRSAQKLKYGPDLLKQLGQNDVSDFTDLEQVQMIRKGRSTFVHKNIKKLKFIAQRCSQKKGVSLSSKSVILSKICQQIEQKSHKDRLQKIKQKQNRRKSIQSSGNRLTAETDSLGTITTQSESHASKKDQQVLDLIVKQINSSKQFQLFNRYIDEKSSQLYLKQLRQKDSASSQAMSQVDAREFRKKLIGKHLLDEQSRERLLDYSVLRDFLYENRHNQQKMRVSQALKLNKFALGVKKFSNIFQTAQNSSLPQVIGPNHIRMDLGKGNKVMSYADKQNLLHRHTVRKALAANMTTNKQKLNRQNNLQLVKFILTYGGGESDFRNYPKPTKIHRKSSSISEVELGVMKKELNFNTVCNYVNLRKIYVYICMYHINFNSKELNIQKWIKFINQFIQCTGILRSVPQNWEKKITDIYYLALFQQNEGKLMSYEEFYQALRQFLKYILILIKIDDPHLKQREETNFDEIFLRFLLHYIDSFYEERCLDQLEQIIRTGQFKQFLFSNKGWLYEWFTLFADFTSGNPTKYVGLKQLTEGCAALNIFPNILMQQQLQYLYRISVTSSQELAFEDFVKILIYIVACHILLNKQREAEQKQNSNLALKSRGKVQQDSINSSSSSSGGISNDTQTPISSANVTQYLGSVNWTSKKYYENLKKQISRTSSLFSEQNIEIIREATKKIKQNRNASKSITGAHFSVNLRAKVVDL